MNGRQQKHWHCTRQLLTHLPERGIPDRAAAGSPAGVAEVHWLEVDMLLSLRDMLPPAMRADYVASINREACNAKIKAHLGVQVMLGVDRLDMIKGIPQKLLAFEKFLDEHPEWADKVLLIQIAVPSRVEVPEYQVLPSASTPRKNHRHELSQLVCQTPRAARLCAVLHCLQGCALPGITCCSAYALL